MSFSSYRPRPTSKERFSSSPETSSTTLSSWRGFKCLMDLTDSTILGSGPYPVDHQHQTAAVNGRSLLLGNSRTVDRSPGSVRLIPCDIRWSRVNQGPATTGPTFDLHLVFGHFSCLAESAAPVGRHRNCRFAAKDYRGICIIRTKLQALSWCSLLWRAEKLSKGTGWGRDSGGTRRAREGKEAGREKTTTTTTTTTCKCPPCPLLQTNLSWRKRVRREVKH